MSSQRDRPYDNDRFGTPIAGLEPAQSPGVVVPAGVRPREARPIRCVIGPLDAQDGSAVHVAAEIACASAELE